MKKIGKTKELDVSNTGKIVILDFSYVHILNDSFLWRCEAANTEISKSYIVPNQRNIKRFRMVLSKAN